MARQIVNLKTTIVQISALVNGKGADIFMIGERLRNERKRLGMTQPKFAEAAGVSKRTLIDWEKGETFPTAMQLSALFNVGVDIQYVVAGLRESQNQRSQVLNGDGNIQFGNISVNGKGRFLSGEKYPNTTDKEVVEVGKVAEALEEYVSQKVAKKIIDELKK